LSIFNLFLGEDILADFVKNTNTSRYAELKRGSGCEEVQQVEKVEERATNRSWSAVSIPEIQIFIGLQVWMGIYHIPAIEDNWRNETQYPIMESMSCNQYQQITRYLHISPPDDTYKWED